MDGELRVYFPHTDYDERQPPSPDTALAMCSTQGKLCPVAAQCYAYALELEAPTGVWGGRAFVDGQPLGTRITNNQEVPNGDS